MRHTGGSSTVEPYPAVKRNELCYVTLCAGVFRVPCWVGKAHPQGYILFDCVYLNILEKTQLWKWGDEQLAGGEACWGQGGVSRSLLGARKNPSGGRNVPCLHCICVSLPVVTLLCSSFQTYQGVKGTLGISLYYFL